MTKQKIEASKTEDGVLYSTKPILLDVTQPWEPTWIFETQDYLVIAHHVLFVKARSQALVILAKAEKPSSPDELKIIASPYLVGSVPASPQKKPPLSPDALQKPKKQRKPSKKQKTESA